MNNVLVIGYGNTLRGDDAAGIRAAELIAELHPEIECVCVHQLTPELAERISEYEIVFFIDADVNIKKPSARLILPNGTTDQPRTHFLSPESLLHLSNQLYSKIPSKAYVVGIPATEFHFNENLSAPTTKAVEDCVKLIESIVTR